MNEKPITVEEINQIDILNISESDINDISERISKESQINRDEIYIALIDRYFYGDISDYSKVELLKFDKERVAELTKRKQFNDNVYKIFEHKLLKQDYSRFSEEFLEKRSTK